ncbi:MAG: HDOD domain-containing protein [Candidatus Delongbacteria bacterium]|nr:HDOD domain-containing protein [Candidatus Delongbacteria bacterium]MBN2834602.1 HDOD domain-containing protein [Candidatus Delongbacteria bacterium]
MSKTVLFIDDDENILKSLRRTVLKSDFTSIFCNNTDKIKEFIEKNDIEIAVVDFSMPKMSGIEVLRHIRDHNPEIVRILLCDYISANDSYFSMLKGLTTGILHKPWSNDQLNNYIYTLLEINKTLKENRAKLERIENLLELPKSTQDVITFFDHLDDLKNTRIVSSQIIKKPKLSLMLLQIANSAFYSEGKILSLDSAVNRLGFNMVKIILMFFNLIESYKDKENILKEVTKIFIDALISSIVFPEFHRMAHEEIVTNEIASIAFTQDIGMLILLLVDYKAYKETCNCNDLEMFDKVSSSCRFNHKIIGGYFLRKWNMPEINVEAAMYHNTTEGYSKLHSKYISTLKTVNQFIDMVENDFPDPDYESFENGRWSIYALEEIGMKIMTLKQQLDDDLKKLIET